MTITSHHNHILGKKFSSALIIAPSGAVSNHDALAKGIDFLQASLPAVTIDASVNSVYQRFAGVDNVRLAAINALENLTESTLVVAARGGYGLSRLLPNINFAKIAQALVQSNSVLCGHSDMTALQLPLLNHLPVLTSQQISPIVHGPMVCFDFGAEHVDVEMIKWFSQLVLENTMHIHWQSEVLNATSLRLTGTLWGGNLAMLCSLLGTPFFPSTEGGVLVVEDVNEHPYRVERMLLQLLQAGVLQKQKAVVFGQFTDWSSSAFDQGYNLQSVIGYIANQCTTPIVTNFPFGHVHRKASLPFGRCVSLTLDCQQAELQAAF